MLLSYNNKTMGKITVKILTATWTVGKITVEICHILTATRQWGKTVENMRVTTCTYASFTLSWPM